MRAIVLLLVAAVLSTACSSDGSNEDATSAGVDVADAGSRGARVLGEPSEESSVDVDDLDADALAFEEAPATSTTAPTNGESGTDDETSSPQDVEPDSTQPAESTEMSLLLDELISFVEQERGHDFATRPVVTMLDGTAFTSAWSQVITDDVQEFADDYENYTDIYRAMGIIDDTATLEEIWVRFGDAGVLGYYDPEQGDIVLRSGEINTFTKTVLVHELVHALDDQTFGIDRPEYDDRGDEIGWTFSALVEGSAGVIEQRYRNSLTNAERQEELDVQRALPRTVSLSEFTDSFLELQFGRYRYGDDLAAALWERGQSEVDAAFAEPPETSEEVIDPDAYLSNAATDGPIDAPPADGEVFESGVWGEAAWAALFADVYGVAEGLSLADGWGGDQFVAWRNDSQTCVRLHVEGDSPDVLDNYALALEAWSQQAADREIFYPTAELVRVTACG